MGIGAPTADRFLRHATAALIAVAASLALALATGARAEGRIVVREGARRLVAISPHRGRARTLVHLHRGAMLGTAVSRDGAVIAFASRTFHKVDVDGDGGRIEREWTDRIWVSGPGRRPKMVLAVGSAGFDRSFKSVDSIALSPDGRELLIQKRAGAVFLMRTEGSGLHRVRPAGYEFHGGGGHNSGGAEFTPDGKRLIGVFYPPTRRTTDIGGIGTVALDGGPVHFLTRGPFTAQYGHFDAPTISPDGRHVAFVSSGPAGIRVSAMNRDGSGVHRLRGTLLSGWNFANPSFSPNGRSVTLVGAHPGKGNTIIGRTPSVLFTIGLDGRRLRAVQTERFRRFQRDPVWVRWPDRQQLRLFYRRRDAPIP
jgi:dipeptidyl aminopeptidase/acylaminoacyl peptidase